MKHLKLCLALLVAAGSVTVWAASEDGGRSYQIKNRLRVEYDDNIYETDQDKTDSFKIIEEIEFIAAISLDQTFISVRYRPTYVYWDEREPDDDDLHHDFDFTLSHNFSERVSLSLKDTLRIAENPQAIDRGTVVREEDDFTYNLADGVLSFVLRPQTRLEVGGRYTLLRYDDEDVSDRDDYDIYAGGLTLRHQLVPTTAILGEYRHEATEYVTTDVEDRSAASDFIGLGVEQIFTPNLLGNLRGGYQNKSFEDDAIDDESQPYVDASITFLPSPRTRLTGGLGYSMFEADVADYANQNRTLAFLSLAHDLTARVSLFLGGSYGLSEYEADQAVTAAEDGDEEVTQLSARASYKVNRNNWLEVGWIYLNLDSDLRENYDRNRFDLGWRVDL
jgi:hypothetical protein